MDLENLLSRLANISALFGLGGVRDVVSEVHQVITDLQQDVALLKSQMAALLPPPAPPQVAPAPAPEPAPAPLGV